MAGADLKSAEHTAQIWAGKTTMGRNGVAIAPRAVSGREGYRSYEIHQRLRVADSTEKLNPSRLTSAEFASDPYPTFEILRENYPCFRDWIGNAYWISRYNDVTSVFVDDANFESRSKRWNYGQEQFGRDLRAALPFQIAYAGLVDRFAEPVARDIVSEMVSRGEADLALDFAARYPLELLARVLDLPLDDFDRFAELYLRMQQGIGWDPALEQAGLAAMRDLASYFRPILESRRKSPGNDLVSVLASLELPDGVASAEDVVVTLLEGDHETLHGTLANLWFLLLTHPEQLDRVRNERRLMKFAYLETLRHSTPVLAAKRFAKHEVERFGLLLPEGALICCAAGAANRDPRVYAAPDRFDVMRKDLCQREPRGQYRADGLPAGIAFGLGPPSRYPALPDDRPRSLYALTRDTAVLASSVLLDGLNNLRLRPGAAPALRSLRVGDMHTCWSLPVEFDAG